MRATLNGTRAVFRARHCGRLRIVVAFGLLVAAVTAEAQQGMDYYGARLTSKGKDLLRKVEGAHLPPAQRKLQSGSYFYAKGDIEFILRYFPNHPRGLALLSELCDVKWKGPRCESDEWFRKAVAINGNAPQTFLVNGVHLHRLGRLPEAIESYNRVIALDPGSGNAHYNLALVYVDQKQYDLANRHAQLAYALGMSLPGLRDKLTRAGQWKPLDPEQLERELAQSEEIPRAAAPR